MFNNNNKNDTKNNRVYVIVYVITTLVYPCPYLEGGGNGDICPGRLNIDLFRGASGHLCSPV